MLSKIVKIILSQTITMCLLTGSLTMIWALAFVTLKVFDFFYLQISTGNFCMGGQCTSIYHLGTHCRLETKTIQPRTLNCPTSTNQPKRTLVADLSKTGKAGASPVRILKKIQAFRLLDMASGRVLKYGFYKQYFFSV